MREPPPFRTGFSAQPSGLGFYFGARFPKRAEDVNGPVASFSVPLLVLAGRGGIVALASFRQSDILAWAPWLAVVYAIRSTKTA